MNKLRPAAWLAFGAGGALLFFAFRGAAATTMSVLVGAGTMQLTAPASGRVQFILPIGAQWTEARWQLTVGGIVPPGAVGTPLGLPDDRSQPLLTLDAIKGSVFALEWTNADGTPGVDFIGFD